MNLNNIPSSGKWSDASAAINENFNRVNVEVEKVKNATIRDKGYFSTVERLQKACPSPVPGDKAWVGSPYPGTVFECRTAGSWYNTQVAPNVPAVDLNNWEQIDF